MTGRWRLLVLVTLLGAPLAACSDDGPGEGEARLEVNGLATVERADGEHETIDDSTDMASGDRVWVTEGVAVMSLRGGTTFELRQGMDEAADTKVLMAKRPVLEAGDLLVTTPESTSLEADGTKVDVHDGAARVTRAFGMSVAAYDADVELDSAGVPTEVPSLRQAVVPDLGRPRQPRPVDPEMDDPWDRRYLGAAMALDHELAAMADQLSGLLGQGGGRTVRYVRLVLPGLEDEPDLTQGDIDTGRDPGDTLIGAAIADLGERGNFAERWDAVFGFRDEGAAWGIVALDQGVKSEPLIGSVEGAFNSSFDELAQGSDTASSGGGEPGETDGGSTDGGGGGTDGSDGGGSGGTDGGTQSPSDPSDPPVTTPDTPPVTPPTVPEPPEELVPVVEPVIDLVDDLLGGLLP